MTIPVHKEITISQEEFSKDPKKFMDLVEKLGRVVLLDSEGKPVAAISRPMDEREVILE